MVLNPAVIGKTYTSPSVAIEASECTFFALAVGETHPAFFDPGAPHGRLAHPLFAAVYAHDPIAAALRDRAVGISYPSLVHYFQEFDWIRAVRPGDRLTSRGVVRDAANYENGGVLDIEVETVDQAGAVVTRSRWGFFDRSVRVAGGGSPPRIAEASGATTWQDAIDIPSFQSHVYAAASGDHNDIHIDPDSARSRGLPGMILHGFCSMAYCARVIISHCIGPEGDPVRLRSLAVRFARPVFPGETLRFSGFPIDSGRVGLAVTNRAGTKVLRNVEARVAPAPGPTEAD